MQSRLNVWKELLKPKFTKLVLGLWAALGVFDLAKSEFFSERYQKLTAIRLFEYLTWRTWLIVFLCLVIGIVLEGGYAAITERGIKAETQSNEVQRLTNLLRVQAELRSSDIGAKEWSDLAQQFDRLKSQFDISRADWTCAISDGHVRTEEWALAGTARGNCEALCKLAGAMLLKSPKVRVKLSKNARQQENDIWRWLYYLKDDVGVAMSSGSVGETIEAGQKRAFVGQSINNLGSVSSSACIKCAAEEV